MTDGGMQGHLPQGSALQPTSTADPGLCGANSSPRQRVWSAIPAAIRAVSGAGDNGTSARATLDGDDPHSVLRHASLNCFMT
jgi:hypothetical protein